MTLNPTQSETLYQSLVQSIQDVALIVLDKSGRILFWNPGAVSLTGYSAEQMLGQPFSTLCVDDSFEDSMFSMILRQSELAGRFETECEHRRADGSCFWAVVSIVPLTPSAEHDDGFVVTMRNITKRRSAEDELHRTLKELSDIKHAIDESAIVAITDKHGIITYVNDTFCRISKYSREELIGKTHRLINSNYHPSGFFEKMWRDINQGKIWRGEVRNQAKDGTIYWVDTTIVPFLDDQGQPYQYIAIRSEITNRKRVEAEIRQLNEEMEQRIYLRTAELEQANLKLSETLAQLQESEKLRTAFVSALTHDLRTPLVAQQRALEILQSNHDKLPEKLAVLVQRLEGSNTGLLEMVNLLLETYQYEAGQINLLWSEVDLVNLVQDCFESVSTLAEVKQIKLINDLPQTLPTVAGDAYHLKRVVMNLLGNALENIGPGSSIMIKAQEAQDEVQLLVQDNGPGIDPEMLPHLFKRYYIGDQTRKKIGTGLGLYICKMIMTQHEGTIEADSVLGQGTCFKLTLSKHRKEPAQ